MSKTTNKFAPEVRERAVRMVFDHERDHPQTLAPAAPAVAAGHIGCRPGLIDEHQALGIEVELTLEPGLARAQDVGAILLDRVAGLFYA